MSKESRMNAKKTKQKYRHKATRARLLKIIVPIAIAVVALLIIIREVNVYSDNHPTADYSKGLTSAGLIEGFDSSMVNLCDYTKIDVALADITATDEYVQSQIDDALVQHSTLVSDEGTEAYVNSTVSIDYQIYVDDEAYGDPATDARVNLVDDSLVPGLSSQIAGMKVGESKTAEIYVSEDYAGNAPYAGKIVKVDVTLKGVYDTPEFNDEFVTTNYGSFATTADGYRQYLKDSYYKNNLASKVQAYISDNSSVVTYPDKYLKASAQNEYFQYYYYFLSYKSYSNAKNMFDYYGMTKDELKEKCDEAAKTNVAFAMYMQAIYEKEGLSFTDEELKDYITSTYTAGDYDAALEAYNGVNYWAEQYIEQLVYNHLVENYVNFI